MPLLSLFPQNAKPYTWKVYPTKNYSPTDLLRIVRGKFGEYPILGYHEDNLYYVLQEAAFFKYSYSSALVAGLTGTLKASPTINKRASTNYSIADKLITLLNPTTKQLSALSVNDHIMSVTTSSDTSKTSGEIMYRVLSNVNSSYVNKTFSWSSQLGYKHSFKSYANGGTRTITTYQWTTDYDNEKLILHYPINLTFYADGSYSGQLDGTTRLFSLDSSAETFYQVFFEPQSDGSAGYVQQQNYYFTTKSIQQRTIEYRRFTVELAKNAFLGEITPIPADTYPSNNIEGGTWYTLQYWW